VTLQSSGLRDRDGRAGDPEIAALAPWFHNLHLPDGRRTAPDHPLGDFPAFKWRQLAGEIPPDLHGARVLDIGCNAGYYSFELARRGAHVLAIDSDEHYLRQARWAAQWLDPDDRVRFRQMTVYELASEPRTFDLVLFLGVLYHLRHPQLALDLVAGRVAGTLVFQTLTMPDAEPSSTPADVPIDARGRLAQPGWPRAAFVEHALAGDPTNWWVPNDACARAMLRSAGMEIVAVPGHELYVCRPAPPVQPVAELRQAELEAVFGWGSPSQRKYTP
jgi:tRNA (mo5U34)-methyltransferase